MDNEKLNILLINSSARQQDSVTRRFANSIISSLQETYSEVELTERDVSKGIPYINEQWVNANFTDKNDRNNEQVSSLSYSDELVRELKQADTLIIAAPLYNFSIPASLKAWIDQIARVGETFNYSTNGPVGNLNNTKAYIVIATGGTELGSNIDFASNYLKHVLGFVGIHDVTIVSAERFDQENNDEIQKINLHIQNITKKVA